MLQLVDRRAVRRRKGSTGHSLLKVLLSAGAAAGAVGSVLALGTTTADWLHGNPEGIVTKLRLEMVRPLTYREWLMREGVPATGVARSELRTPGRLVVYDLDTKGFEDKTTLPGRIVLHDVTHHVSQTAEADLEVTDGESCGCADWIPVPRGRTRYYLEVAVFPPGPVRGEPLKSAASGYFRGSRADRASGLARRPG
jgi:hypothetical protein